MLALLLDYKYIGFILFCRKSENARNLDFIRILGIFFLWQGVSGFVISKWKYVKNMYEENTGTIQNFEMSDRDKEWNVL